MYENIEVPDVGFLPGGTFRVAWAKSELGVFCLIDADDDGIRDINNCTLALFTGLRDKVKEMYGSKIPFRILVEETETKPLIGDKHWELCPKFNNGVLIGMERGAINEGFFNTIKKTAAAQVNVSTRLH